MSEITARSGHGKFLNICLLGFENHWALTKLRITLMRYQTKLKELLQLFVQFTFYFSTSYKWINSSIVDIQIFLQKITKCSKLGKMFNVDECLLEYRNDAKFSDTQKICCNHSKIWTMWLYHRVMSPNDADGMANRVDPDQTAPLGAVWSGSALFAQPICPKT